MASDTAATGSGDPARPGGTQPMPPPTGVVVDIELTNRCNASCVFCPRDQTPHQGLMTPEVLAQAICRVVELAEAPVPELRCREVSFCGLGEQLLNRNVARYVKDAKDAGLTVSVNTNAALLDEARGEQLLEAGVTRVFVNAGEIGAAYEATYKLPFDRAERNITRFAAMAEGRCDLYAVLVDHARDAAHQHEVERFWRQRGVRRFFRLDLLNRGGTLDLEGMDFERAPQHPAALARIGGTDTANGCLGPFAFPFVGYDGTYYLCSSDWTKQTPLGNVFERSILDVVAEKYELIRSRQPVCKGCNHDAANRLTALMAARDAGEASDAQVDALAHELNSQADGIESLVQVVASHLGTGAGRPQRHRPGRLIPVTAT